MTTNQILTKFADIFEKDYLLTPEQRREQNLRYFEHKALERPKSGLKTIGGATLAGTALGAILARLLPRNILPLTGLGAGLIGGAAGAVVGKGIAGEDREEIERAKEMLRENLYATEKVGYVLAEDPSVTLGPEQKGEVSVGTKDSSLPDLGDSYSFKMGVKELLSKTRPAENFPVSHMGTGITMPIDAAIRKGDIADLERAVEVIQSSGESDIEKKRLISAIGKHIGIDI